MHAHVSHEPHASHIVIISMLSSSSPFVEQGRDTRISEAAAIPVLVSVVSLLTRVAVSHSRILL
jgi:hypothetical protein